MGDNIEAVLQKVEFRGIEGGPEVESAGAAGYDLANRHSGDLQLVVSVI